MGRVLTLLYHRVRMYNKDIQLLSVTPEHFAEQMDWLKANYKIVRFDEDWDQLEGDAVCITFDDDYRDNFLTAVPILEQRQIPAMIFVTTGNMDTGRELWWDELERNLLINKKYPSMFRLTDEMFGCEWNVETPERREDLYYTLHWLIRHIGVDRRNDWIRQLQEWNGYTENGREENQCVRLIDLKDLDTMKIQIGAHTVNHPDLAKLEVDEQRREIKESKQCLEVVLEQPIVTFSYPFGGSSNYNGETIKVCRKLGFTKVAANIQGIWKNGDDLFQIPRYIVRDWDLEQFKKRIKAVWEGIGNDGIYRRFGI